MSRHDQPQPTDSPESTELTGSDESTVPTESGESAEATDSTESRELPNRAARRAQRKGKSVDAKSTIGQFDRRGHVHDQVTAHRQVAGRRGNR